MVEAQRHGAATTGRLVMWNLITLDGMFEGAQPWELTHHAHAWGEALRQFSLEQAREVGALVFGRRALRSR